MYISAARTSSALPAPRASSSKARQTGTMATRDDISLACSSDTEATGRDLSSPTRATTRYSYYREPLNNFPLQSQPRHVTPTPSSATVVSIIVTHSRIRNVTERNYARLRAEGSALFNQPSPIPLRFEEIEAGRGFLEFRGHPLVAWSRSWSFLPQTRRQRRDICRKAELPPRVTLDPLSTALVPFTRRDIMLISRLLACIARMELRRSVGSPSAAAAWKLTTSAR